MTIGKRAAQRIAQTVTGFEKQALASKTKRRSSPITNFGSYLVQTPGGGIPARSGTTLGSATCTVQLISSSDVVSAGTTTAKVLNLSTTPVAGSTYITATRTKAGDYIADEVGGGSSEVAVAGKKYTGLTTTPTGSHTSTATHNNALAFTTNDSSVFDVNFNRTEIKVGGIYYFCIPWSVCVVDPGSKQETAGPFLVANGDYELEYDAGSDKFLTNILNGLAAEGNNNPQLFLYQTPAFRFNLFVFDNNASYGSGTSIANDAIPSAYFTHYGNTGTDADSQAYEALGLFNLNNDDLDLSWHGVLSGSFGIQQSVIDSATGDAEIYLQIVSSARSGCTYDYTYGGSILYLGEAWDGSSDYINI